MSAFSADEQRRKALANENAEFQKGLSAGTIEQQRALIGNSNASLRSRMLSNDLSLVQDQARARTAESNVRAVAPRYQGTGLAQMFGAQGVASAKTKLGQ